VVVALVSAGIGAAVAVAVHEPRSTIATAPNGANQPAPGSIEDVAAKVAPSVVRINTGLGRRQADEGSGIVLTGDGLILTDAHAVADAGNGDVPGARVTFSDGRTAPFSVVGTDPASDIAVIRCQGVSGLAPIKLGSSVSLRVGQQVVAVGSPLGLQGTVTSGLISALNRQVSPLGDTANQNTLEDVILTDAAINPGISGGALVNMNAELIGVNAAIVTASAGPNAPGGSIGLSFAIPVDQARRFADQLIATGRASHASLGVDFRNDPVPIGARIIGLKSGGPAAAAGLPNNALVTKFDDLSIDSAEALVAALNSRAPGDKVTLTYVDPSGSTKTAQVILGTAQ
jgi:putative serine protease PepD